MGTSIGWSARDGDDEGFANGRRRWLRGARGRHFFRPPAAAEATMLEEGVGDHRHERVTVKTAP